MRLALIEAQLHHVKGELLLAQAMSSPDSEPLERQAQASFQQTIETARQQHAKSYELRAAMSLTRLWQKQGHRRDARELLAPIYGWFTEGFDTPDLKEAKALLEELA